MRLRQVVTARLAGRRVFELACGTGYWTAVYAPVVTGAVATDRSPEMLSLARSRMEWGPRVAFRPGDAFAPDAVPGEFDACFAGFWWSHVSRPMLAPFLSALHRRLASGTVVLLVDNRFVEGSNIPIARWDADGNSYQQRMLTDGRTFDVLKNFPTAEELLTAIRSEGGIQVEVGEFTYYWYATYVVGPA